MLLGSWWAGTRYCYTVLLPRDSVTWHVTNNQLCCQQRAVRSWWKPLSVFLFVDIPCDADVAWWRSQLQKVQNRGLNIYFGNCIFRKFSTNMIYDYEYHFVYLILYAIMHKYLELNWDWIIFRVLVTSGLLDMMIDLVISASRSSVPAELLTGECQCPSVDGTRSGDTGTSYLTLTLLRYIRRYIQTLILSTIHSLAKISLSSFAQ